MAGEKIKIIGILGGIGSGKSTVATQFGQLGCAVIDADAISHEILAQPDIKKHIKSHFGRDVFDEKGDIDKQKLADRVFENEEELKILTSVIHPPVMARVEALIDEYKCENTAKAIILDIPLLAEVSWENRCDFLIFVDTSVENRAFRAQKRGPIDKKQLKNRENLQISLDKKADMSHYILNNNSDVSTLMEQVEKIFTKIINGG